jgi:hypothetical protein
VPVKKQLVVSSALIFLTWFFCERHNNQDLPLEEAGSIQR